MVSPEGRANLRMRFTEELMLRKREKPCLVILYNYERLIPFLVKQSSSFLLKFAMDRIPINSIDNTYITKNEKELQ